MGRKKQQKVSFRSHIFLLPTDRHGDDESKSQRATDFKRLMRFAVYWQQRTTATSPGVHSSEKVGGEEGEKKKLEETEADDKGATIQTARGPEREEEGC